VALFYQRALRDLRGARGLWAMPDWRADAIRRVSDALAIIKELHGSLNPIKGREATTHLSRIYEFMQYELMEAISAQDNESARRITAVVELLQPLSDVWNTEVCSYDVSQAATPTEGILAPRAT
jgi:flagellin-specific chaperone FliS